MTIIDKGSEQNAAVHLVAPDIVSTDVFVPCPPTEKGPG